MRGHFGIGVYWPKCEANVGTLWRSAHVFEADYIFTIGQRYRGQRSDTAKTPRHVPLWQFETADEFFANCPSEVIAVELGGTPLGRVWHPERVAYLLGAEDSGLPVEVVERCSEVATIPTGLPWSLNVAVAGSIVLHDRFAKRAVAVAA